MLFVLVTFCDSVLHYSEQDVRGLDQQLCAALANRVNMLTELVAGSREQTPGAGAGDINFNSPGHRSSQDGSFIQVY